LLRLIGKRRQEKTFLGGSINKLSLSELALCQLFEQHIEQLVDHIWNLPAHDRYLRFGYVVSRETIEEYVKRSFPDPALSSDLGYWFAIFRSGKIIASVHISLHQDTSEFGLTTDPKFRGQGIGQLLFSRAYQLVTEHSISRIYMSMLSENKPMIHIAKKFGCAVMIHGPTHEASVTIEYPVSLSQVSSVKNLLVDKALFV
jgi:RimJ/RimL family protein N-acetyltransferase